MIVTIAEGSVPPDREEAFSAAWNHATEEVLPPGLIRTFLLRAGEIRRIATVWESREALDAMRAEADTPAAIAIFRAAGVEPAVTLWDVDAHVESPG
jgi:heme-degrading monooxygenase HmoA